MCLLSADGYARDSSSPTENIVPTMDLAMAGCCSDAVARSSILDPTSPLRYDVDICTPTVAPLLRSCVPSVLVGVLGSVLERSN